LPDLTLAAHHVGSVVYPMHHLVEQFWGILEVGIDDQNTAYSEGLPLSLSVPVIARQVYREHVCIGRSKLAHYRPRAVLRAVVVQDDFVVATRCLAARGANPPVELS
jgi:hypothetical protein